MFIETNLVVVVVTGVVLGLGHSLNQKDERNDPKQWKKRSPKKK